MAEQIFQIVAEDKQKHHIPEDMHDITVHKHRAQEIEIDWKWRFVMLYFTDDPAGTVFDINEPLKIDARHDLSRNQRKRIRKRIVAADLLQKQENENVNADKSVVDKGSRRPV